MTIEKKDLDTRENRADQGIERRFIPRDQSEVRVVEDADKPVKISGYFAKFMTPSTELGSARFIEIIETGFFSDALTRSDVYDALNHDVNFVFGRQSATGEEGRLITFEDDTGLYYDLFPLKTRTAEDMLIAPIRAGIIKGCSFAFRVKFNWDDPEKDGDSWNYNEKTDTVTRLLLKDGCDELIDGSQVVNPAYDFSGGISLRSRDMADGVRNIRARNDRRSNADCQYDEHLIDMFLRKYGY